MFYFLTILSALAIALAFYIGTKKDNFDADCDLEDRWNLTESEPESETESESEPEVEIQ